MDTTQWYAIALGGVIALFITTYLLISIISIIRLFARMYFLQFLVYPQIPRYLRGSQNATSLDVLVLIIFLLSNVLTMAIGVNSVAGFLKRSGLLSVINTTPLFLGGQMNALASRCGIGLRSYARTHRWLGRVTVLEGLIHAIVATAKRRPSLNSRADVAGVIVSIFGY